MCTSFSFTKFKASACTDNFNAVIHPSSDHLLDVHDSRQTVIEGEHIAAECDLHIGEFIDLVDHHIRDLPSLEVNDNAHPLFVRLITDVRNTSNGFIIHQIGNTLN